MDKGIINGIIIPAVCAFVAGIAHFCLLQFTFAPSEYAMAMKILPSIIMLIGVIPGVFYYSVLKNGFIRSSGVSVTGQRITKELIGALIMFAVEVVFVFLFALLFSRNNDLMYYFRPEKQGIRMLIVMFIVSIVEMVLAVELSKNLGGGGRRAGNGRPARGGAARGGAARGRR